MSREKTFSPVPLEHRHKAPDSSIRSVRLSSGWLPYLVLLLLVEIALFANVAPSDPDLWAQVQRLRIKYQTNQQVRLMESLRRHDPSLGSRILAGSASPLILVSRKTTNLENRLLLFIGSCASCEVDHLRRWREIVGHRKDRPMVIVSRDSRAAIETFVKSEGYPIPIVADADGDLARSMNAFWLPRAYGVSPDGRLRWIQTRERMTPAAIAREVWTQ